ncbi:DNA helicase [Klebsiella pneumoniae]|nr:DNA helicase [Klebsiella pneumoniae]
MLAASTSLRRSRKAGAARRGQGAAATGRPLCAPCAMRDLTQKINRKRNVR